MQFASPTELQKYHAEIHYYTTFCSLPLQSLMVNFELPDLVLSSSVLDDTGIGLVVNVDDGNL
jgi:hypothetical protein